MVMVAAQNIHDRLERLSLPPQQLLRMSTDLRAGEHMSGFLFRLSVTTYPIVLHADPAEDVIDALQRVKAPI